MLITLANGVVRAASIEAITKEDKAAIVGYKVVNEYVVHLVVGGHVITETYSTKYSRDERYAELVEEVQHHDNINLF